VLAYLADKISEERGWWYHSGDQLAEALNLSRETCDKATKLVCELGILSRDRENRETPYTYRFIWECPNECQATSHMVERKSDNPSREKSTRGGDKTSQHIREPITETKEEVMQSAPASLSCNCERSAQGLIHLEDCPGYLKLQESKAWEITKERNASEWPYMNAKLKQLAHLESLADMTKRNQARDQAQAESLRRYERDFEASYKKQSETLGELSPAWKQYAKEINSPTAYRSFSSIGYYSFIRFAYYTEQGLPVPDRHDIKDKHNPYADIKVPGTDTE